MTTRKYHRMTISFEVVRLPEDLDIGGYFENEDDDDAPGKPYPSYTIADDQHEDILDSITLRELRETGYRKFKSCLEEGQDLGDQARFFAFMAVLAERFFVTDITIHHPVAYEEPTK